MARNLRILEYTVPESFHGKTVEAFLREEGYTKKLLSSLKRMQYEENGVIRHGIEKNGKWVFTVDRLSIGDHLRISILETEEEPSAPDFPLPLEMVYEDQDILLLNKPAGIPCHPSPGHFDGTLAGAIVYHYEKEENNRPFVCRLIHRLDLDTSGILLVAKNQFSASFLNEEMQKGQIRRRYTAFCIGNPYQRVSQMAEEGRLPRGVSFGKEKIRIHAPIARTARAEMRRTVDFEIGQDAITNILSIQFLPEINCSLLSLELETGRTHQIRVHLAYIACPLLGDFFYGTEENAEVHRNGNGETSVPSIERQALHSSSIRFIHPVKKKEMHFSIPLPADMQTVMDVGEKAK